MLWQVTAEYSKALCGLEPRRAPIFALPISLAAAVLVAITLGNVGDAVGAETPDRADASKARGKLDVLILGDSQLSFGSGKAFYKFFTNLDTRCRGSGLPETTLKRLAKRRVGIIGVRSTGVHTWLSRTRRGKRMICVKDPAGLVNASAYGAARHRQKWVQIGESRHHQFCKSGRSALETMFSQRRYQPKLMVFNFLGLSASRWRSRKRLDADLRELDRQVPMGTACLILTTAPTYEAKINAPRLRAQRNLQAALGAGQHRCRYVPGLTKKTVRAMQGNRALFYKYKNGRVKDPYHPNDAGSQVFLRHRGNAICRAVAAELDPETAATGAATARPVSLTREADDAPPEGAPGGGESAAGAGLRQTIAPIAAERPSTSKRQRPIAPPVRSERQNQTRTEKPRTTRRTQTRRSRSRRARATRRRAAARSRASRRRANRQRRARARAARRARNRAARSARARRAARARIARRRQSNWRLVYLRP
ncbi:MAG: hypothetical protein AAFR55_02665 [Pseudomonadota bacterium]